MLGEQLVRAAPLGVAVVPVHPQRAQAPLGVVERLADDRDALLDRDHRGDAGLGERRAVIDRGGHGAELGRVQHHRGQHPGQGDVDGEPGVPEDLPRGVDPEPALGPDELVPARVLGTDVVRDWQLRGARGEVAEARPLPARVAHRARLELDFLGGHAPGLGRGRGQPRPRLGGNQAVTVPEPLGPGGRAGQLDEPAPRRGPVHIPLGTDPVCRADHPDRGEVRVQFLRHDQRQRGVRPLPHLGLVRVGDDGPVLVDADVRVDRIGQLLRRQRRHLQLREGGQRLRGAARGQGLGGLGDGVPDARVGAAPAQVPVHPLADGRVIGRLVLRQERGGGQGLAGLAVSALDHVAPVPRVPDRVDDRAGSAFDGGDRLADGGPGRCLARLGVAPVDQHRARRALPDPAAVLRPVQFQHVPQHPQQRAAGETVVNLDIGTVHVQLHDNLLDWARAASPRRPHGS